MIVFEVRFNNNLVTVAGGNNVSSISAHVDAIYNNSTGQLECQASINGSNSKPSKGINEFLTWFEQNLTAGDKIEITVVDSSDSQIASSPLKKLAVNP